MMDSRSKRKQYLKKDDIGQGSFGEVSIVYHKTHKKDYAMKVIPNVNSMTIVDIQREITIMKKIHSRYAIKIHDDFHDEFEGQYCIVCEYYKNGDLKNVIQNNKFNISDQQIINLIFQIREAFIQLNNCNVIHRDLKPANILVSDENQYRVCDFGCSKFIEKQAEIAKNIKLSKQCGTRLYNAPQIFLNQLESASYNLTVDVWSMGIIVYQIIYGQYPVKQKGGMYAYEDVDQKFRGIKKFEFQIKPSRKSKINGQIKSCTINLLKKMLQIDKDKRIKWIQMIKQIDYVITDIDQILNHAIYRTKIICLIIDMLNQEAIQKNLLNSKIDKKIIIILKNCLIMLQYDQMQYVQKILKKQIKQIGLVIMPHVYDDFKQKNGTFDFYEQKQKSYNFRKILLQTIQIQKIRSNIQIKANIIWKTLQNLSIKDNNLKILNNCMHLLQQYRKECSIKNTNTMQKFYYSIIYT